jgi:hypothetical protein
MTDLMHRAYAAQRVKPDRNLHIYHALQAQTLYLRVRPVSDKGTARYLQTQSVG